MNTLSARMLAYIQAHPNCKRRDVMLACRFPLKKGGYAKRRNVLDNLVNLGLVADRFSSVK
jgi:hypothetical protein